MDEFQKIIATYGPGFMANIAEPVWHAAVKQVVLNGVTSLVWGIGFFVAFLYLMRWAKTLMGWARGLAAEGKVRKERGEYVSDDGIQFIVPAVAYALAAVVGAIGLGFVTEAIRYAFNPEWYAIQELVKTVATKK